MVFGHKPIAILMNIGVPVLGTGKDKITARDDGQMSVIDFFKRAAKIRYTLSAMIGMMSYWYRQTDQLPSDQLHELIKKLTEQGVTRQLQRYKRQ
jgi:hypothetical protein